MPTKRKYYIKIEGQAGFVMRIYKVEARSYEEALEKAKEMFMAEWEFGDSNLKEYKEFQREIGEEDDENENNC